VSFLEKVPPKLLGWIVGNTSVYIASLPERVLKIRISVIERTLLSSSLKNKTSWLKKYFLDL
jgi:hypothetical protein